MDDEREIDLKEVFKAFFKDVIKYIKIILFSGLVVFLIAGLFGVIKARQVTYSASLLVRQEPRKASQTSDSKLEKYEDDYIQVQSDTTEGNISEPLSIDNIISILKSDFIFNTAYKNINITEEDYDHNKVFEITKDSSSDLINIVCKISDEELATKLINEVVTVFKEYATQAMDIKSIDLINGPRVAESKSAFASFLKYGLIGFAVDILLICCFLFFRIILDDKARTEEDIVDVLKAPIISKVYIKSPSYGIKEIKDYLFIESKGKVINFITITKDDALIESVVEEMNNCKNKIKVIDSNNLYKDNHLSISKLTKQISQDKKNNDYVFVTGNTIKESHDYALVSKYADTNIVVVKKNNDKLEELSQIVNSSNIYNFKINGVVYTNVD